MNNVLSRSSTLPVPVLLIASVVAVSVLGWVIKPLWNALLLVPYRVRHGGQVHRLLTAGWVHGDIAHLVFNMLTLYFFASPVLKVLGTPTFLALYVSAVVLAFVPTTLRRMNDEKYSSLGASGAVAAVMFSAILLDPTLKIQFMFIPIPVPGAVFAVGYLLYSAWGSRRTGTGVNHDAHFAGAIYGAIFTFAFHPERVQKAVKSLF